MATEMVLIPKSAYDRWAKEQNQGQANKKTEVKEKKLDDSTQAADDNEGSSKDSEAVVKPSKEVDKVSGSDNDNANSTYPANGESSKASIPPNVEGKNNNRDEHQEISAIIELFPKNYRLYAKRLLVYIKKKGGNILGWNDKDKTLIYKGNAVTGSDIIELINHIFKTNAAPPTGIDAFRKGLTEISVPKVYLKPYLLKPPGVAKSVKKKWAKY